MNSSKRLSRWILSSAAPLLYPATKVGEGALRDAGVCMSVCPTTLAQKLHFGTFLANVNSRSRSLYAIARPSVVCLSSVCRLKHSCTLLRRFKFSAIFLRHLVPWPSTDIHWKFHGDRPRGTLPPGELNTRGVVKYSDLDLSTAISRKRCKIGSKLVLITYRKS